MTIAGAAQPPHQPTSRTGPGEIDPARRARAKDTGAAPHPHGHLWSLADGTGLHAPYGQVVAEPATGRVCCHLCGRWFVSLGGHLRTHGHTADSYREAMGLCRTRPLIAQNLSRSIADRQARAYRRSPTVRARLATGQQLSRTGQLTGLARTARAANTSSELARIRRAALDAGRATRAARRERALAQRLAALGIDDLAGYLREACAAGASLRSITAVTGLGWARLRREIDAAGITPAHQAGHRTGAVTSQRSLTGHTG